MSLRINHNIDAMIGHTNLLNNSNAMSQSLQRLSSGLKINSAADDPAGLVISEQMRAQISGLDQAVNNSETAVSMVQTAEGALDEVNSLLDKARQLTLDAANTGVNDTDQVAADQAELDNVIQSISRIADFTQFGTKKLLDGSLDGATNLVSMSHVHVGNLANNPSITPGQVNLVVTAGTKEGIDLKGTLATDSYIFSGTVTGVSLGANRVVSGVTVTLAVASGTVNFVTSGAMTATNVAAKLNALTTNLGYSVAANGAGEMVVTRNTVGSTNFAAQVTYTRGPTSPVVGVKEKVTSSLKVTLPSTNTGAAAVIFSGVSKLSGVQTTSVVNGGTIFAYTIQTATGGVFSGSVTVTTGTTSTMSQVLSGLQTSIQGKPTFAGATVSLDGGGASGTFLVGLQRGSNNQTTDFSFALTVDHLNAPTSKSQADLMNMAGSVFTTGAINLATFSTGAAGATAIQGSALVGSSFLIGGNAMDLTVSGVTLTFTGARTLNALAAAMQSSLNGLGGNFANLRVAFVTGGTAYSGLAGNLNLTGNVPGGFRGFTVYSADGRPMAVSLKVDQKQGTDVNVGGSVAKPGLIGGGTLNLTTVAQSRLSGAATVIGQSGRSVSSTSGASLVTSGVDFTAVMTTANAVVLNLATTHITSGGVATLTLTSGSQALGYNGFSTEVASSLVTGGGVASFTLDNGAVFQVGANAGQQVGVTIDSLDPNELGRNVTGAGSLLSLNDLQSSQKGALTNGLSTQALKVIDATIDEITNLRGRLGAVQANTLQSGLDSLRVSQTNLTSAESTIRDVDFAEESANFSKNQILVQSATAMLAQANQLPQNVLKLLQ